MRLDGNRHNGKNSRKIRKMGIRARKKRHRDTLFFVLEETKIRIEAGKTAMKFEESINTNKNLLFECRREQLWSETNKK